ncbi:hypothetical protein SAMN05421740_10456 [Parapedobacter koreensis]|uniref:Uncharacterized protein n=1 Tax=Parapedobacter koreensis TaxID=332977 RepID=A0A1H7NPH2_9SPHI|nr:hypothetical protein SAMN05421740_10456 [Parapedobacter koreensis]
MTQIIADIHFPILEIYKIFSLRYSKEIWCLQTYYIMNNDRGKKPKLICYEVDLLVTCLKTRKISHG